MAVKPESRVHKAGATLDFWWKVARAAGGFAVFVWGVWVQFLGPGLKPVFQDFVGMTEALERLDFIEIFMPAPIVVDWNQSASFQSGDCSSGGCVYVLNGSRTEYGDECGPVIEAIPFLRNETGQIVQIGFDGFRPVELTRTPRSFPVPLSIPEFIGEGQHDFRVRLVYKECLGRNEPIPRFTPWFPLKVSPDS